MLDAPDSSPASLAGPFGSPISAASLLASIPASLISWHIASEGRALMLSVTYCKGDDFTTVEVEYDHPGIHGELPRGVEDDLIADVARHYGNWEFPRYFEQEVA
jgi:hypothetical protein